MGGDEKYDVVIVGAGHNGTTAAAYLARNEKVIRRYVHVLQDSPFPNNRRFD